MHVPAIKVSISIKQADNQNINFNDIEEVGYNPRNPVRSGNIKFYGFLFDLEGTQPPIFG